MQGENFKFGFIMVLSVALLIALLLPLSLGVLKPHVFHPRRVAGLQTICFGAVIGLSLAIAGYLLLFFEASNSVLAEDRYNGIIFCLVIAAFAAIIKFTTRLRHITLDG